MSVLITVAQKIWQFVSKSCLGFVGHTAHHILFYWNFEGFSMFHDIVQMPSKLYFLFLL